MEDDKNQQELEAEGFGCVIAIGAACFAAGLLVGALLAGGWLG